MGHPKKSPRNKNVTEEYLAGSLDDDRLDVQVRFTQKSKHLQANKTLRTSQMRAGLDTAATADMDTLPLGQVTQVFSLFCEVEHAGGHTLCSVRKTVNKISNTAVVVGDRVRFRPRESLAEQAGPAEGVIEQVAQRTTVLTRADSFKGIVQHPIVANADQMLIVAALHKPRTKWGLIDRMLIAGQAGGLATILCLNKVDLSEGDEDPETIFAHEALAHYQSLGVTTVETSVTSGVGLQTIHDRLRDRVTVLAGHSGVGKSSLISAIVPGLHLKVGDVSVQTEKGRHTTTGARRYPLPDGHGTVIDTPGVKLFGLWNVTAANLDDYFPDIEGGTAPAWRRESFERIKASLAGNTYD